MEIPTETLEEKLCARPASLNDDQDIDKPKTYLRERMTALTEGVS